MSSEPITSVFNDGYIAEVYELFRRDPASVDESWRQYFRFAESLSGTAPAAAASDGKTDASLLRLVPHDRMLVESDAPYLAPVPNRGHRNEPAWVAHTVAQSAALA